MFIISDRFIVPLIFISSFIFCLPASARSTREKTTNLLVDQEIKIPFPKAQLTSGRWSRVAGRYGLGFFPHRDVEKYYRRESLDIDLVLSTALDSNFEVNFGPRVEAEFVRPFYRRDLLRDKKNNLYSNISLYRPKDAPHSPDKALALLPGEYYSFSARLGFQISAKDALGSGIAFFGPYANYGVHGDFKLTVYRLGGSKVKVIASSQNEKRLRIGGHLRTLPDIDVFEVRAINNLAENLLEINLVDWEMMNYGEGSLYSVSFVYDLNKKAARKAFDKLMNLKNYKLKELRVLNPKRKHTGKMVRKILLGKIDLSEQSANQKNTGVERDYVSSADYERHGTSLGLNVILSSLKSENNYLEMDYQIKHNNKVTFNNYKVASYTMARDYRVGRRWRESDIIREGNVIFAMNAQKQLTRFEEINFSFYRADVKLKSKSCLLCQDELPYVLGQIRKMLPASWYEKLGVENKFSKVVGRRTVVDLDVIINPVALELLQHLNTQEIDNEIEDFIETIVAQLNKNDNGLYFGQLELISKLKGHRHKLRNTPRGDNFITESDFLAAETKRIKTGFHNLLRKADSPDELLQQWSNFNNLRGKKVFRELFSGLTIRLLERAAEKSNRNLNSLMQARFVLQAEALATQEATLGHFEPDEFNKVIMRDRDRILNRNFNPEYFD